MRIVSKFLANEISFVATHQHFLYRKRRRTNSDKNLEITQGKSLL